MVRNFRDDFFDSLLEDELQGMARNSREKYGNSQVEDTGSSLDFENSSASFGSESGLNNSNSNTASYSNTGSGANVEFEDSLEDMMKEYNVEDNIRTENRLDEFEVDKKKILERDSKPSFLEEVEIEVEDPNDYTKYLEERNKELSEEELIDGLSPAMVAALEWSPPNPKSDIDSLVNEWIQTGWVGFLHIDQILTEAIITGASDVHITADQRVSMTRNGDIIRYDGYVTPDEETMHMLIHDGILNMQQQAQLNKNFEYEGAYTLMYGPMIGRRTRLTIGRTFGKYFMVFRIISETIPKLSDLGVEEELVSWSKYPNGLFLLCGPTGSGKSTTLASILRNLQLTTKKKMISIEKPIEYIYPDDAPSLFVQRDVGEDTRGFYEGLTSAMRQSPNVILLGEVRNTEEVTELLRAAETGHLAISTMHTNSVPTTINRIQNLFSGNEQLRIMSTLADTLRGIGNQVLVKKKDGTGRFAVRELLSVNKEIKDLIIAGDIRAIRKYQVDREATMEHKLTKAVVEGLCHYEDALEQTTDPNLFHELLEKEGFSH